MRIENRPPTPAVQRPPVRPFAAALQMHTLPAPSPRCFANLVLQGQLDDRASATLQGLYHEAANQQPVAIVLNFEKMEYMNSTGIALIVDLLAQARRAGIPLIACGLSEHYQEIFEITRLADYLELTAAEGDAFAAAACHGLLHDRATRHGATHDGTIDAM